VAATPLTLGESGARAPKLVVTVPLTGAQVRSRSFQPWLPGGRAPADAKAKATIKSGGAASKIAVVIFVRFIWTNLRLFYSRNPGHTRQGMRDVIESRNGLICYSEKRREKPSWVREES
jgi:hypothetical protein